MTIIIIIAVIIFLWWSLVPSRDQRAGIYNPPINNKRYEPSLDEDPIIFNYSKCVDIIDGMPSGEIKNLKTQIIVKERTVIIKKEYRTETLNIIRTLPPKYYGALLVCDNNKNIIIEPNDNIKITERGLSLDKTIRGVQYIK